MGSNHKTGIGIIGCGVISTYYLRNLTAWPDIEVVAVADLLEERAHQRAAEFNVGVNTVEELLANPKIEIIVNLTIPAAHFSVGMAALAAGKSVYNEKPLTIERGGGGEQIAGVLMSKRLKANSLAMQHDTIRGGAHL